MEQLKKLYASLSRTQRLAIVSVVVVTAVALALFGWHTANNFKPLYTSLSQQDAGAVVQKLKQSGVEYRLVDNGSTVLVPAGDVAESRLEMALVGLPKTGRIGFELFDRTNLGVTEFAEHINYQRALEGELERSVMSLAEVEQARVHITFAKDSVFTDSREPAKASVLLKLRPRSQLSSPNVVAISHLVAAAVEGLTPGSVSVLDMYGNLLSRPKRNPADVGQASDSFVEYQQSVERSLVTKINATLEPLLGEENFRAGVSVDFDFTSGEESKEFYDPSQSVMVTSHLTEETSGAGAGSAGIPGTPSALPQPRSEGTSDETGTSRRTENIAYQTSRTVRRTKIPQGTVKKVSAAVLVDYAVLWEGEGEARRRVLEPRSPNKMQAIRELVAAAIGLDVDRGDQLIVQTLPFESTLNPVKPQLEPMPVTPGDQGQQPQLERLKQQVMERFQQNPVLFIAAAVAGCLLLIFMAWGIRRSRKRRQRIRAEQMQQALGAPSDSEMPAGESLQAGAEATRVSGTDAHSSIGIPGETAGPAMAASQQLPVVIEVQGIVKKDAELSAGIVHEWLLEDIER